MGEEGDEKRFVEVFCSMLIFVSHPSRATESEKTGFSSSRGALSRGDLALDTKFMLGRALKASPGETLRLETRKCLLRAAPCASQMRLLSWAGSAQLLNCCANSRIFRESFCSPSFARNSSVTREHSELRE
jgi:hypothetical protein